MACACAGGMIIAYCEVSTAALLITICTHRHLLQRRKAPAQGRVADIDWK
jgi:hypothetical protein